MAAWDMHWDEGSGGAEGSVVSCTLTRRSGLAYDVDIALSTTDAPERQLVRRQPGRHRPLAEGGTRGFSVTLPGSDLRDVPDGPIRFLAPKLTPTTALVVTVIWADHEDGVRQEQSFIHGRS